MADAALAVLFAVFVWWASTGLVLLLDSLPRDTFRWSALISSAIAASAFAGLVSSAAHTSVASAYCAFTCALLVWAWHELSFLTGWITGPNRAPLPVGATGWRRFRLAVAAILWHELAIIAVGVALVFATWDLPNQSGTVTFLVLWIMRTSAKLNLYLGVRNFSEAFLPPHLAYLQSYFRRRAVNVLFPFSVTLPTIVLAVWVASALDPATPHGIAVGHALAGTMLALAILEHWLLVLPIEATALWRWAMRHKHAAPGAHPSPLP